jgi:hypothetical protein
MWEPIHGSLSNYYRAVGFTNFAWSLIGEHAAPTDWQTAPQPAKAQTDWLPASVGGRTCENEYAPKR